MKIIKQSDHSHGIDGIHLGHLLDYEPTASRLRYCVNSLSLDFEKYPS
ncbi:peptide-methionine (R)-S-oxide reductase [Bacteroidetes bacterium endosymbiont of Geopemphigus sp.]|nr:peptide-methionine (R)-S-oxide reductase [Bacteroidetes bacterium endosymbiont of Geopemphigus sp.]